MRGFTEVWVLKMAWEVLVGCKGDEEELGG